MTRGTRGLLAVVACAAWIYAAFLTDRLFSYVAMGPSLENRGWLAMGLRSGFGATVFAFVLGVFSLALTIRRKSGPFELSLWVMVMDPL
jgi:uncharacterized membrane protein